MRACHILSESLGFLVYPTAGALHRSPPGVSRISTASTPTRSSGLRQENTPSRSKTAVSAAPLRHPRPTANPSHLHPLAHQPHPPPARTRVAGGDGLCRPRTTASSDDCGRYTVSWNTMQHSIVPEPIVAHGSRYRFEGGHLSRDITRFCTCRLSASWPPTFDGAFL